MLATKSHKAPEALSLSGSTDTEPTILSIQSEFGVGDWPASSTLQIWSASEKATRSAEIKQSPGDGWHRSRRIICDNTQLLVK